MKISQLCQMIQNSFHDGIYPLEEQYRRFSNSLQVINRSDSDDMQSNEIKIEVKMNGLYIISNYVPNIEHLPGVIEADVLDSFRMLCRRLERITDNTHKPKGVTVSPEKLRSSDKLCLLAHINFGFRFWCINYCILNIQLFFAGTQLRYF